MATKTNLRIIQGDSKTYNLTFRDSTGAVLNISTWTVLFTVKRNFTDADASAVLSKTVTGHTDPTHGLTAIVLAHTDTETLPRGTYSYSIQVIPGDITKLYTLLRGTYTVEEVADRNT